MYDDIKYFFTFLAIVAVALCVFFTMDSKYENEAKAKEGIAAIEKGYVQKVVGSGVDQTVIWVKE